MKTFGLTRFAPHVVDISGTIRPEDAFQSLAQRKWCAYLDSARQVPGLGRYSFLAAEPFAVIEDADQVSNLTGPCGDTMKIFLNIEGDRIDDAKIQVLGCPGAVASGSALIYLAKGKTLDEAWEIDVDHLHKELERLPDQKLHCTRLAVKTLQKALEEYRKKCRKAANSFAPLIFLNQPG